MEENSFYYDFGHSKAPGFGMAILFHKKAEEANKPYSAKIISFSKIDENHTERVLLGKLLFDLSELKEYIEPSTSNTSTSPNFLKKSTTTNEKDLFKPLQGAIYLYTNNSPCFSCGELYTELAKNLNINFHVYYTQVFSYTKLPPENKKEMSFTYIYKTCFLHQVKSKEKVDVDSVDDEEYEQLLNSVTVDEKKLLSCLNTAGHNLLSKKSTKLSFSQINLNVESIPKIKKLKNLLRITN